MNEVWELNGVRIEVSWSDKQESGLFRELPVEPGKECVWTGVVRRFDLVDKGFKPVGCQMIEKGKHRHNERGTK